jgi:hypothetical protein
VSTDHNHNDPALQKQVFYDSPATPSAAAPASRVDGNEAPPADAAADVPTLDHNDPDVQKAVFYGEQPEAAVEPEAKAAEPEPTTDAKTPEAEPQKAVVDPEVRKVYDESAAEFGMTEEQAQQLVDKVLPVMERRQREQVAAIRTEWFAKASSDPLLRSGQGFEANAKLAREAIARFGDSELQELLNGPLGSNPALVRFTFRVARATRGFRMPSKAER